MNDPWTVIGWFMVVIVAIPVLFIVWAVLIAVVGFVKILVDEAALSYRRHCRKSRKF